MHKDLFTIFGYTVQTHAVVSVIAILLGLGVALTLTRKTVYYKHMYDFIFWALVGAIIGARFWHVFIFQWSYYSHHLGEIIAIWQGGISILGAIVGGAVALVIYSIKHKLDFLDFADFLSPAMMLGMGIGRIACFFAGDAFGKPTGSQFGVIFPKGTIAYETYGDKPLWPAISWEIQGDFVIFAILLYLFGKNLGKGWLFTTYIFGYGCLRFVVSFFRGDSPEYGLGLTAGQWTSIVFVAIAIIMAIYLILFRPKKPDHEALLQEENSEE
ncbi:prolipoprotein diacylglyceryl transferase [Pullulanibacillus camelliae]|uniref:Phosphatidylglycerol--prolipoprotein diacylglyceryl transferase n=1 Tax=Pullulanibacillus camelliae TaxID=1707096 RepID=A0A8J2YEL7_9BACL|nr:prolipoprotein diacylglyceryl transferase [Pullulanibacillus camelliae]GGE37365.1 prolipoprotein diacylglyceryl transferase [Pullulanibacillus camelliae]